ncbi:MAG: hypothetical protein AABW63_00145 [Nanoarchaeota archaeon]
MATKRGKRNSFYKKVNSLSRVTKYFLVTFFIVVIVLNIYLIFSQKAHRPTGFDTSATASVIFAIEGNPYLKIFSPQNITYNFSIGQPYIIDLNVTSDTPISLWTYSIYDLKHNWWAYRDVAFSSNTTFAAVRWGNAFFVNASTSGGKTASANVTFFVSVPNSAPILLPIDNPIYVCEGSSLNYLFNATDVDEDDNVYDPIMSYIGDPSGLFFSQHLWRAVTMNYFAMFSGNLFKSNLFGVNTGFRNFPISISVSDGQYSDTNLTNVTLVEINNPPWIDPIGVQTIWHTGENSTLYKNFSFGDIEYSPPWNYGSLSINTTIVNSTGSLVNLFNVSRNGTVGTINFTSTNSTPVGIYNVNICVSDTGLTNRHPLIQTYCNQTGLAQTTCEYFQLTITNQNRPPTITAFSPNNSAVINVSGTQNIRFNITKYDPDFTIPDSYWYIDNVLVSYFEGNSTDIFDYVFPCGISGKHDVKAEITDGEFNDSVYWNFSVSVVSCSQPSGGGGGGGGGGIVSCKPQWGCTSWNVCQNAESSLNLGILSRQDYRIVSDQCQANALTPDRCGFQIRVCPDLNNCSPKVQKPEEVQSCLYTPNPSCSDGIKNCHDGDCEILIDCGGPCNVCASCTDKKQNQGEEGVDCGGPCPWICEPAVPLLKRKNIIYSFLLLILIIIAFIITKLIRIIRYRKIIDSTKRPNV